MLEQKSHVAYRVDASDRPAQLSPYSGAGGSTSIAPSPPASLSPDALIADTGPTPADDVGSILTLAGSVGVAPALEEGGGATATALVVAVVVPFDISSAALGATTVSRSLPL